MKYLSLILVLLVLATAPSCKFLREKKIIGRKKTEQAELLEKQRQARVADSLKKVRELTEARESARLDSIRIAEEQRLARASRYNIVVGAFITPEYARQWADEYRSRGYNPEIIQMEGGRFELVVAEAYENAGEAVRRVNQFQDTVQIDAWIY
ncbi:MAG: SPOR domain-containing protein, partial [Bacteroidales bacterium]|nr:SPOR domain-containing protein [Bacteroidales bacterium]